MIIRDEHNLKKKIKCKNGRQLSEIVVQPSNKATFSGDEELRQSSVFNS